MWAADREYRARRAHHGSETTVRTRGSRVPFVSDRRDSLLRRLAMRRLMSRPRPAPANPPVAKPAGHAQIANTCHCCQASGVAAPSDNEATRKPIPNSRGSPPRLTVLGRKATRCRPSSTLAEAHASAKAMSDTSAKPRTTAVAIPKIRNNTSIADLWIHHTCRVKGTHRCPARARRPTNSVTVDTNPPSSHGAVARCRFDVPITDSPGEKLADDAA